MSMGDAFVVAAAQTLMWHSQQGMSYCEMVAQLDEIREEVIARGER